MMTKKDFEEIARCLDANEAPLELVQDFADMFGEQNPRFNRAIFIGWSTRKLRNRLDHMSKTLTKELHGKP